MVQLKVSGEQIGNMLAGFQFLMVQLKGLIGLLVSPTSNVISIPYGAIKRSASSRICTASRISIPYGAIKSHSAHTMVMCYSSNFNSLWCN